MPDGRIVEDFYGIEMPDYAVVVATTADGILVERSYKHGPGRVGLHLPAGYLEPGEDALQAAQRELREETGYAADTWKEVGRFTVDGNRGAGTAHIFHARDARRVAPPSSHDLEQTELDVMPMSVLLDALRRGEVALLGTAAAIALVALDEAAPAS